MERAVGIEPTSSAWKAEVIAIIRCTHRTLRDWSVQWESNPHHQLGRLRSENYVFININNIAFYRLLNDNI